MRLTLIETKTNVRPPDAPDNSRTRWRTTFTVDQNQPTDVGYLLDANGIWLLPKKETGKRVFVHWSNVRFTTAEPGGALDAELKAEAERVIRAQQKTAEEPGGKLGQKT